MCNNSPARLLLPKSTPTSPSPRVSLGQYKSISSPAILSPSKSTPTSPSSSPYKQNKSTEPTISSPARLPSPKSTSNSPSSRASLKHNLSVNRISQLETIKECVRNYTELATMVQLVNQNYLNLL